MNKYVSVPLKLVGTKAAMMLLSIFFMMPFSWLITNVANGMIYYSIITALFYFSWIYGDMFRLAGKDIRPHSVDKPYVLKGAVMGLIAEIPAALMLIVLSIAALQGWFLVPNIVYIAWMFPYFGFVAPAGQAFDMTGPTVLYYTAILYAPVVCGLGYFAGMHKFSITERYLGKIIYKKKK